MGVFSLGLLIAVIDGFVGGDGSALTVSVILQGFGQGIIIPLLLNMVLSTVADTEAGMASGVFSTIQTAGSAFGVTIVGMILFGISNGSGAEPDSLFEPPVPMGRLSRSRRSIIWSPLLWASSCSAHCKKGQP